MRPTIFTDELASDICRRLSLGESARQICRDDAMPVMSTLMKWLTETDKVIFSEQYARARDCQADYYADEIIDIADELGDDVDSNAINKAKLRIDSRKWKVARMSPRKYGDKQQIDHTSSDDSFKPTVIKLVAEPFPDSDD
jgi:hypothetical protein|tara:strand:+ start:160 stop:582 length:423 start_codon:yes stop_codon:yes gene_type:complete